MNVSLDVECIARMFFFSFYFQRACVSRVMTSRGEEFTWRTDEGTKVEGVWICTVPYVSDSKGDSYS